MKVVSVRLLLKRIGVIRLDVNSEGLIFTFSPETPVYPKRVVALAGGMGQGVQFLSETKMKVKLRTESTVGALLEAKRLIKAFHPVDKDPG